MKVKMTNGSTTKTVKIGFSWVTLLFTTFWVRLFRGDEKVLKGLLFGLITAGIYNIVKSFSENKDYINRLIAKGYKGASEDDSNKLRSHGFVA